MFCLLLFLLSVMFFVNFIFFRLQSLQFNLVLNFYLFPFKISHFLKFQLYFNNSVVCLLLILLNEDLWFLYLCLKLFPVDPEYCLVDPQEIASNKEIEATNFKQS